MEDISLHIIELLKAKDEKAIDLLYEHYSSNLYGYIYKIIGTEEEAQDILQDAFVKIWKNSEKFDENKSRLFTWILNICRNQAIDKLRVKNRLHSKEIQNQEISVNKYSITQVNTDHLDLKKHVEDLEDKYKDVIEVLFFQGMTQKEASENLEIPLGTVKTRLKIGLRELHKIYKYNKNKLVSLLIAIWMIS